MGIPSLGDTAVNSILFVLHPRLVIRSLLFPLPPLLHAHYHHSCHNDQERNSRRQCSDHNYMFGCQSRVTLSLLRHVLRDVPYTGFLFILTDSSLPSVDAVTSVSIYSVDTSSSIATRVGSTLINIYATVFSCEPKSTSATVIVH